MAKHILGVSISTGCRRLGEQTVVVTGTKAASTVLPRRAEQLALLSRRRAETAVEVERVVQAQPL